MDLNWYWAYREQIHLFYAHDAFWIECAKNKWAGKEGLAEFRQFLISYGLMRGQVGRYLADETHLRLFINKCNHFFSNCGENLTWGNAQEKWNEINSDLYQFMEVTPSSATLKAFWFYQPSKLPMYDRFVRQALTVKLKPLKVSEKNYIECFGKYFDDQACHEIKSIEPLFEKQYISRPRVGDKYLWLQGNKDRETIMRNFKAALDLDKISYAAPTNGSTPAGR